MKELNNSATRILALVETAIRQSGSNASAKAWAAVFGLDVSRAEHDPHDVTLRLQQIRREIDLLEGTMQATSFSPGLYKPYLDRLRRMVSINNLSAGWSQYAHLADGETLLALRYCAEIVTTENLIPHEEMQALLDEIHRFRNDIADREISASAKDFLIHQLAIMEDGIQAYPIQGKRGIKDAFKRVVAEVVTTEEEIINAVGDEQISRLQRLWTDMQVSTNGGADFEKLLSNLTLMLEKSLPSNNTPNLLQNTKTES